MGLQKLVSLSSDKKAHVEQEQQAMGTVSSATYKTYLKSVHPKYLVFLFLTLQVVKIVSHVVLTLSLGWWAESSLASQFDYYIQQYGASLFFNACSSLGANVLLTLMMVSASM